MFPLHLTNNHDAQTCFWHLTNLARNFDQALALFDHALILEHQLDIETRSRMDRRDFANIPDWRIASQFGHWKFIAARDAAITVCDFKRAMDLTKKAIYANPDTAAHVNNDLRKFAFQVFNGRFRDWENLRNAATHASETCITQEQIKTHGRAVAQFSLAGRTYSVSGFNRAVPSMEISSDSSDRLWQVAGAIYESLHGRAEDPFTRRVIHDPALLTPDARSIRRGQYLKNPFARFNKVEVAR